MIPYDRQRSALTQQQHSPAIMSQNVPSSAASNLSPTQSQMSMQGRLQSQSQLDSMRSMSQQPSSAAAAWSGGYHAQPPSQAAYPSVMNPYMPYGATGPVQNHNPPAVAQSPTARPPINQKSSNGNAPYPAPMYGQPPSSVPGGNGSYYGYDPYYNQMASQAPDPYLSNSTAATASQHWSSNNQMISNSSGAPTGPAQAPIRPQVAAPSSSLQSPKDLQSSSDHMIPYDRQRSALTQQQHSPAIMSQNVPSSAASNLSPTQSQMSMQGRLQSQSQLDSMRSMSQQPSAGWSGSYYAQPPSQSPYPSVMNPYGMPYGATGAVQNHSTPPVGQSPTVRPPLNQKPTNGSERVHAPYPTHGATIYGQPPTSVPGGTGTYYGYDSYYSQMASQAPDPYLSHSTAANASQHWSGNNQMISNSSGPPPGLSQPTIRPQTGSTNPPSIHPQSPSGSTSLPMSRPPQPQPSLRQDRSPAATHSTSYPSPNQQSSSSKSTSNSLAQLEQMVMPSSGQSTTNTAIKSPTHRSTTSSPSINTQQQMQYSFNSSGQGSYFSNSGSSAAPTQGTYYPQPYDSGSVDVSRKSDWSEQSTSSAPMIPNPAGPVMIEGSQSGYGQSSYDGAGSYSEYTTLSAPNQARFPATGESGEPLSTDKSDPYAIDSQTFDDYDDQSSAKSKKSRAKKGDDKVKKERKPRAPRAPKGAANAPTQPQSPSRSSLQSQANKQPLLAPNLEMSPGPLNSSPNTFSSPNQSLTASVGPPPESQPPPQESIMLPGSVPNPIVASKSPAHRLSTESPSATQQQQMQYSYSPATQPPSLYQPSKTPERSPAPTHSTSYPSPNQQSSSSKVTSNSIVPTEPMVLPSSGQSTTNTAIKSPTHRSTTSSPSINTQQQMQYSFNSSGQGSYFSNSGTSAASSQGTYYPQPYDSANVDLQQKPGWSEQNATSAPVINPVADTPTPAIVEGTSQSGYVQPGYENTSSYGDYSTFSASNQSRFPTPSEAGEPHQSSDKSESFVIESQTQEDDQIAVKSKKSRAKKSDDKVKKERKPRAPRASKGSSSAPNQSQSPSRSDEQCHPLLAQNPETSSVPQSVSPNTFSGSSQQLPTPILPGQESQPIAALSGSAPDSVDAPGSPVLRMSTESPNGTQQQMQYSHSSTSAQILDSELNQDDATMPTDQQLTDELQTESKSEQPASTPKAKKSRPKKSGEKPKKERKSRAVKEPQPAPEPSGSPIPADETTEPQPVEPTPESTPAEPKPKRIRIRDSSSKGKKKLPKFALKFAKTKKRKRLGSSDNDQSDLDKTPPPSPDEVESGVQKRRSARNTKKLKYNDDLALGFSDSDDDSQILSRAKKASAATPTAEGEIADETVIADEPTVFAAPVEDTMVVEKIMSSRMGKRELEPEPGEVLPPDGTHIDVEEFYVKYKNLSYLHCDWRTLEELEKGDRRVAQKIKRWKQKKDSSSMFSFMDEEVFDPQYCEVDRILAMNEVEEEVPESDDEQEAPANEIKDATPVENNAETEAETCKPEKSLEDQPATEEPTPIKNQIEGLKSPANQTSVIDDAAPKESEISQEPAEEVKAEIEHDQKMEAETEPDKSKEKELSCVEVKMDCNDNVAQASDANIQEAVEPVEKPRKMKKKISRHFLVKWRGLSYEDSTWELEDHLDPDKIKHFLRFKDPPPKSKWKNVKRPKPEEWVRKEASPVYKNNNTLREYQLEGINWLSFCWHQGRNCILADEMGLGKTIQSIAFVNEIYEHGINGPFLIIVPLSTVGNWAREFETWTDLNVITYHGSSTSREMLKEYEMFYRNEQGNRITSYYKFQVMITTFEIILSDCLDLREIPWKCCIIDEAHRLKNRNCKLLEGLRLLNMEHRVLLTGTPLQNNVEELFSLLNFLEPTQFSSTEQFMQEFGDLKTEAQVDKLKLILKPMMLRRLKEDVEKTLAPKEETIVEVELTNIQKKYYRAILEKNFAFLAKGSTNNNIPNLMNTMMELRKCCIHPYLINGAEEQIMYEARQTKTAGGEPMSSHQALVNSSGKLVLIDKLLPRLRADGHRVLIFSQMVRCLDILEDYVTHKHYPFERIDGRVRGSDRQQAIDRFSKPGSDRFVFLLCTRAGGLGINLTAADTVIIFDSDWNPQNDLQAQARCHRIGQSKAVKIYRLICRNTYEREMFDKASLKLGLDKAVLQSMNTQKGAGGGVDGQLTKKEIEELLRKGAYGALMDDDNAGDKFCEEDIDHILQRRTQVITIDNSEAKGSTFSKATFSSSNNREDIELDDPNFWEKWAKKANFDADDHDKDELIQLAPRRRTQTKRYGADGNLIDISDLDSSEEDEETISMRTRGSRRVQPKLTPVSNSKRSKKRFLDFDDDEYMSNVDGGYWSKSDCLKIEKGLLTYGWGRWDKIISSNHFKRDISAEDCESISRVILLYCLKSYKGDEKIKSFAWELITPPDEANKSQSDLESVSSTRGRKPKSSSSVTKKSIADEISESSWSKEAKNDPLIALPDDQYRRHLQRNCNRLLIRVKFLHYLKNDILKGFEERILSDVPCSEIDLPPVSVDGELPAPWWDDEADRSLLIGIYKHGHEKFNLMRQDPTLCFLARCGPPNKDELAAEMNTAEKSDDLDDDGRIVSGANSKTRTILGPNNEVIMLRDSDTGIVLDDLVDNVARDVSDLDESKDLADENKNSVSKCLDPNDSVDDSYENGVAESSQTTKMDMTDDDSMTNEGSIATGTEPAVTSDSNGEISAFPSANDLNQRFRRLITAYQRNSKKLEVKMAQKARDELKKERTSKFEAAKNEREERKKFLAQKWSRREEADFFRAISSFGVEYDPVQKRHDWNKFRSLGKLDKKLDDTLEEYYKAFVIMCKKVTSRPLTVDEEKCPINVESITEERAAKCLARIEFLSKIREQTLTHPELPELLKQCAPQNDLPDWWEMGKHDQDLLLAAAKHGLTRLDYNLAHDSSLSFCELIRQKAENLISQPPTSIFIPLEQMQELLDRNGIEYSKELDLSDESDEITGVISDIIASIEAPTTEAKSFADLVDGPHSVSESSEKSLLAITNPNSTTPKLTRSSANLSQSRSLPSIISRRSTSRSDNGIQLTPVEKPGRSKVVEITPIMPDKLPDELTKSFEAGEITVKIISESALVKLDDRDPIILAGATNPVNLKIRWPRDKAIQTRLENLVTLVEKGEWPTPPKPTIPTITLPNPIPPPPLPTTPLNVFPSPPKNDKSDFSLGSPKSDTSNMSKQESRDALNDLSASRNRRTRGRRPKQPEAEPMAPNLDSPKEDRNATAKLRNLLSQGSNSKGSSSPSTDKPSSKLGNSSKQSPQSSPLTASFKQKRNDGSGSSRARDDQALDLNTAGSTANLLPQILASLKPEFRDLLANQDAAAMLLNSFSNMTGAKNLGANLKSGMSGQFSLDNLLNPPTRSSSTKGPPPAHQRPDNAPSGHSSTRELRRGSHATGDKSPPSFNLRSTRGRGSPASDTFSHSKPAEMAHNKTPGAKKRGRPSSTSSETAPNAGSDVLDLSSLDARSGQSSSRQDSRPRRNREYGEDSGPQLGGKSSPMTKGSSKNEQKASPLTETGSIRTTRASKRASGSRIDALALNLQAKRMNRGDSPTLSDNPSPGLNESVQQTTNFSGHASNLTKSSNAPSSAAPTGNRSSSSSGQDRGSRRSRQSSGVPTTMASSMSGDNSSSKRSSSLLANQAPTSSPQTSQIKTPAPSTSLANTAASLNFANQFGNLNPLGGLMNFPGMNELMLQMGNFSGLAAGLPKVSNSLLTNQANSSPQANQMQSSTPSSALPQSLVNSAASLNFANQFGNLGALGGPLNFSGMNEFMKQMGNLSAPPNNLPKTKQTSNFSGHAGNLTKSSNAPSSAAPTGNRSSSSSGQDRGSRRSRQSSGVPTTMASSMSGDNSSSKRSSSLLANQAPTSSPQTSQIKTPAPSTSLANTAASLNFANQFGNLNPLGGLMNFPGMNELMLQMGNFSGLAAGLPKVSNSLLTNQANSSPQANQMQTSAASSLLPQSLVNSAASLNFANQFGNLGALGGPLNFSGMNEFMKQMSNLSAPPSNLPKTKQTSNFSGHASNLTKSSNAPSSSAPTSNRSGSSSGQDRGSRRSRQSSGAPNNPSSGDCLDM